MLTFRLESHIAVRMACRISGLPVIWFAARVGLPQRERLADTIALGFLACRLSSLKAGLLSGWLAGFLAGLTSCKPNGRVLTAGRTNLGNDHAALTAFFHACATAGFLSRRLSCLKAVWPDGRKSFQPSFRQSRRMAFRQSACLQICLA
ncbi:hypothetical protein [Singulisphaera sp. PoT]|uniref:hypothetical protein n=1 Tax=Singulisphaera sp. PoT TaxID=3411797 RepID=UPI003BF5E9EE